MNVTELRSGLRGLEGPATNVMLQVDIGEEDSLMLSVNELEVCDGKVILRLLNDDEDALADKTHIIDEALSNMEKLQEHRLSVRKMLENTYQIREQVGNISHLYEEIRNIRRRLTDMETLAKDWRKVYDSLGKQHAQLQSCHDIINQVDAITSILADNNQERDEAPQEIDMEYEEDRI